MEEIKQLRERTGAGIVDCKAALSEAGNDIEKAIEILRKKGIAKAAKRSDRETKAGIILVSVTNDNKEGFILEMNAETDFVVRNDQFKSLIQKILDAVIANKPTDLASALALKLDDGNSIEENFSHLSGVIGEKIGFSCYDHLVTDGLVAGYAHPQGNIGVLVALKGDKAQEIAHDVAMHIAAANPRYINSTEVDPNELEKEKEIYREQLKKEGKPEDMIEKILMGKISKYYEEVCLVDQEFIKDDKKKVKDILGDVIVEKFIRYSL